MTTKRMTVYHKDTKFILIGSPKFVDDWAEAIKNG